MNGRGLQNDAKKKERKKERKIIECSKCRQANEDDINALFQDVGQMMLRNS